jgi:glycosyltransferase 2 family protein
VKSRTRGPAQAVGRPHVRTDAPRPRYHRDLGEKKSSGIRSRVLLVVTNLVSIGCLVWALRDAKLGELKDDLASMNWWWVAVAVIADVVMYFWHAMRWRILLRPVVRLRYWDTVRAIYVGLFANEVLPFRVGEVLRCYLLTKETRLLAKQTALPFSVSLTSALIERVFDGIWLSACLFVMLRLIPIPRGLRYLVDGGYVLTIVVLVLAVALGVAMFHHYTSGPSQSIKPWRRQLRILCEDLEIIGHSRSLLAAFLQSLPYLLLGVIPIYASFRGYGFDLSLKTAFGLMVILRLGGVVPQAPGNLGVFQFLARESLVRIFNVVPDEAARFSLVLWAIVTLPLMIGGAISLVVTGSKLGDLNRAARTEASEMSKSRQ